MSPFATTRIGASRYFKPPTPLVICITNRIWSCSKLSWFRITPKRKLVNPCSTQFTAFHYLVTPSFRELCFVTNRIWFCARWNFICLWWKSPKCKLMGPSIISGERTVMYPPSIRVTGISNWVWASNNLIAWIRCGWSGSWSFIVLLYVSLILPLDHII